MVNAGGAKGCIGVLALDRTSQCTPKQVSQNVYGVRIWLDFALPDSVFPSGGPTSDSRLCNWRVRIVAFAMWVQFGNDVAVLDLPPIP
jgi:hypothetical protein